MNDTKGRDYMRLDNLHYILEVAKIGSISAAAKKLYMGTTSLSAIVRSVEEELGTDIFFRTTKGLVPTEKGQELLQQISVIATDYDNLLRLATSRLESKKSCTVACYPALASLLGPYIALKIGLDHSYLMTTKSVLSRKIIQTVAEGTADIGIATVPPDIISSATDFAKKNNLILKIICTDTFSLCINASSPLGNRESICMEDVKELQLCSATYFPQFTGFYPNIDFSPFSQHSVFDDTESLKRTIAGSNTVAFMPSISMNDDIYIQTGKIRAVPLIEESYRLVNFVVYPNQREYPDIIQKTLQSIKAFYITYTKEEQWQDFLKT